MADVPGKRGRPPLDRADQTVHVSLRMPAKQYDACCTQALQRGLSVAEVIRRDLRRAQAPTREP